MLFSQCASVKMHVSSDEAVIGEMECTACFLINKMIILQMHTQHALVAAYVILS